MVIIEYGLVIWGKEIDKDSINIIIFGEKNETAHNDSDKILDS